MLRKNSDISCKTFVSSMKFLATGFNLEFLPVTLYHPKQIIDDLTEEQKIGLPNIKIQLNEINFKDGTFTGRTLKTTEPWCEVGGSYTKMDPDGDTFQLRIGAISGNANMLATELFEKQEVEV